MLDWEQIIPELLDAIASGETVTKVLESRRLYRGDVFRKLLSEKWDAEYQAAREAGALARLEANTERLEALAEQNNPSKEKVNAARWAAANAQWLAERSDSKRWGREDRLKVQSVSAVRVIVETPPVAAMLPPVPAVSARILPTTETPRLVTGGDAEGGGEASGNAPVLG